ncbi:arylamine N-acetyltransferase [Actinomadura sp. ATCC 31491]|uniref:Arylamine N-acetyltransferase n=1 Tax=Actinomadura luzonensis TaxID=2805427 RepID=A0ABT0G3N8_9ACTN|nr:arylamine N-acetyltransferase [Actinomadura luzonensis]MCK2219215.1 arylamine N-acetyltransferase [Actinomadura luzonensis]
MTWDIEKLDLNAYLARIRHDGPRAPTAATLRAVHRAHVQAIPFENLDVVLGRGVRLDLGSLQDKLVTGGRGGYCHEHNLLFAAALERLGFGVTRHLARIRVGGRRHLPRTHATLTVRAEGRTWLADVGFGGDGLVEPMPFEDGATLEADGRRWRLARDGGYHVLHAGAAGQDAELYAFRPGEPFLPSDFEVANFYVAHHPRSPFRHHVLLQRVTAAGERLRLEDQPPPATAEDLRALLDGAFGITVTAADAGALLPLITG